MDIYEGFGKPYMIFIFLFSYLYYFMVITMWYNKQSYVYLLSIRDL